MRRRTVAALVAAAAVFTLSGHDCLTRAFVPAIISADVTAHGERATQERGRLRALYPRDEATALRACPWGLEDVANYPALTAELLRRGYSELVRNMMGQNVLRVDAGAQAVAAQLQKTRADR